MSYVWTVLSKFVTTSFVDKEDSQAPLADAPSCTFDALFAKILSCLILRTERCVLRMDCFEPVRDYVVRRQIESQATLADAPFVHSLAPLPVPFSFF